MQTFADRFGRSWSIEITVAEAKRVRDRLGLKLYDLVEDKFSGLSNLLRDPVTLIDVIYVLCQPQIEKAGLTDEQFGAGMAGESIGKAGEAFVEAYLDFFQDPRVSATLRRIMSKGREAANLLVTEADAKLSNLTAASVAEMLRKQSGRSPE